MISYEKLKNHLTPIEIQKYCGVKLNNGEEVFISDQVQSDFAVKKGEKTWKEGPVWIPIRSYNFKYAVWKAMNMLKAPTVDAKVLKQAIIIMNDECFEIGGQPRHVAKEIFDIGYIPLIKRIDDEGRTTTVDL